ncbi:MAG TPA: hypothetical protein VFH47_03310 [Candidatus Thermoplasmatota archaeon]|nr:hypothetical protein [Candidatus Thermoplasmatota archaeon]
MQAHGGLAVGAGVRRKVRHHLGEAVHVPRAGRVALGRRLEGLGAELGRHAAAELQQVGAAGLQGDAAAEAQAREVEELVDHTRHAIHAGEDAVGRAGEPGVVARQALDELRCRRGGAQRVAQVVAQDADEGLAEAHQPLRLLARRPLFAERALEPLLAAHVVVDVGVRAEPAHDAAGLVPQRLRAREVPSERAVGAAQREAHVTAAQSGRSPASAP